ncbi:MAG TPA: IclR family transcriptional regulator [Lactobacillus sp.]|nr:IclR family transcriptional regulator [Lactobacillus sp.]
MPNQKLYGTALVKAKEILDFMLTTDKAPELRDICVGVGINKPTTLKILNTMVTIGMLRRIGTEKQYYFGTSMIGYGEKAANDFNILNYAEDELIKLRDETDETINLGIESDDSVVLLGKWESKHRSIRLKSQIGGKMNLYSSSMGKAILATWDDDRLQEYTQNTKMVQIGPNTITKGTELLNEIDRVRENGYSTDNEENEQDVYCLGFSLVKDGNLYGAFSITAPKYRMTEKKLKKYLELAIHTQQEIEKAL